MIEGNCKRTVYPQERWGSFHGHQCHHKVWKDGFCRQHHPEEEEKRRATADRKFQEKLVNDPLKLAVERIKKLETRVKELRTGEEEKNELGH